jgi:hypothetical protein
MYREIESYRDHIDAWQTKVQHVVGIPFPGTWIAFSTLLFLCALAVIELFEPDFSSLTLIGIECVLIAAAANAVIYYENILDEVADAFPNLLDNEKNNIKEWLSNWYNTIFWSRKNIYIGIIIGLFISLTGLFIIHRFYSSIPGKLIGSLIHFAIGMLCGSMMWVMIGIARLMSSLGRNIAIKPSIFDTATSPLRAAAMVLWKVSIVAALIYFLGISIFFFCPSSQNTCGLSISGGFGVFLILYFIVPQVNIHKTLLNLKGNRLRALVFQIDSSFDKVAEDPSQENITQLRDLFELQKVVNGKNSWSFGLKELLILMGSVIIPLIIFLIDFLNGQ